MRDYEELYQRFLNRKCSWEEAVQLLKHFRTQAGDEELVKLIESRLAEDTDISQLTATELEAIVAIGKKVERITKKRQYRLRRWLPYAAAVLLVVGSLSWLLSDQFKSSFFGSEREIDLASEDIFAGGNQATLQLSDGRIITLDDEQNNIVFGSEDVTYSDGTALADMTQELHQYSATDTLTLTTPKGGTYQVTLSDGTKIWLNAGTTLKYPARFAVYERVVFLEGEAFFEVAHKSSDRPTDNLLGKSPVPFKVISNGQEVEVLGTKFNIADYKENKQAYTTLTEGKVRVYVSNSLDENSRATTGTILNPGQQSIASDQAIHVKNVDTESYTAWKDGFFHFDDALPEMAVAELARWYNLDVEYKGKVPGTRLFGVIDRKKPLSAVLKSLEMSGLTFKVVRSGERNKLIILGEK